MEINGSKVNNWLFWCLGVSTYVMGMVGGALQSYCYVAVSGFIVGVSYMVIANQKK